MNVVFVNYYDFRSPSGMHIFHLANALAKQGVACAVHSSGEAETAALYGRPRFLSYDVRLSPRRLAAELNFRPGETVVHCWTPRERSRVYAEPLTAELRAPVVIHMEDNEEAITQANLKRLTPEEHASGRVWGPEEPLHGFSHPERHRAFLAGAAGYTCIIESLLAFKPEHVPGHVFWPSCEPEVFAIPRESSPEEKARWGIAPETAVIFYPGNLHRNNAQEVMNLYAAVALLRRAGRDVRIIKFGQYSMDVQAVIFDPFGMKDVVVDLTDAISPSLIPEVMRAADILVQPGEDNAFNQYRFPCKLPLFMASGRPVILPPSNLGQYLADGENCLILGDPSPQAIAARVAELLDAPEKAAAIGAAGREFARGHFSWEASARGLKEFYERILRRTETPTG